MKNDFESLGAHLRNLLTPYANLIELVGELLKADKNNDERDMEVIISLLNKCNYNNIQDIIDFSFIEQMEKINWRDSKLYHMQQALEMMKEK